ncbi:MAG: isoprenylcysteine carboxyl methyltransferase family protein [Planctomycetota bacterium]|jgi:methyltransferase
MSQIFYVVLIGLIAIERIAELLVSRRNAEWSFEHGGRELGQRHYPVMVIIHAALLVGCLAEMLAFNRLFTPALGWTSFVAVALAQGLRWWCISILGPRWNTRVIVVPGLKPVSDGPYALLNHPNHVAVVIEGLALPLVHGAWITALTFTVLNTLLLAVRVRCENAALATLPGSVITTRFAKGSS